ncbi:MAG: pilus assembly protein [Novosphingobium sp.]
MIGAIRNLRSDRSGVAAIEFGIIAPVMAMFMMGAGDLLYGSYAQSILLGAVQKAGRDATLQQNTSSTATTEIDNAVMTMVYSVAPSATFVSTRENYTTFSLVDKPEPFVDSLTTGTIGVRDAGECYTDINGNSQWDSDGARSGVGGASDVAQYTITVTYPRVFPVAGLLGWGTQGSITAQTLLKNQPYAAQASAAPQTVCT